MHVLRWILLLLAMLALGAAFRTESPGMLALCLLVCFVSLLGGFFGFVAARVGGVVQGQSSREIELLMTARKRRGAGSDSSSDASGAVLMASGVFGAGQQRPHEADGDDQGGADGGYGGGDGGGGGGDGGGGGGD